VVTGAYFCNTSGMGPGTGVAEAGAIVCCAEAVDMPVAATMAAAQTLGKNILVSTMAFPPRYVLASPFVSARLCVSYMNSPSGRAVW
jgi:hypothetical protein